jgi:hypothetical protein
MRVGGASEAGRVVISEEEYGNIKDSDSIDNLTHIGPEGIQIKGTHDPGRSVANSYIDLRVTSGLAKITAVSYDPSEAIVSVAGFPASGLSALRVYNGGAYISNGPLTENGVSYDGSGNSGYSIYCAGSLYGGSTAAFVGDVTANTSDRRLKKNVVNIDSPLEKISKINGVYFNWNETAKELMDRDTDVRDIGFIAQEVQAVLPEIIRPAPFDSELDKENSSAENKIYKSKSGEDYLTIQYEKIVPLLVECIKELKSEIEELKKNR